jgi:hypothetical protein
MTLNEAQLEVLRWVDDGCPDGVMHDHAHRISAAALRNRDLIKVRGRGKTWRAELTDKGRAQLEAPPATTRRRVPRPNLGPPRPSPGPVAPMPARSDPIPTDLRGAHHLVQSTRSVASELKPGRNGLLAIGPRAGIVHMKVSRAQLHRALLLAHGLIAGARTRGWEPEPYNKRGHGDSPGVAIAIREHRYPIQITEETTALPFTDQEVERWRTHGRMFNLDRRGKQPPARLRPREPTGKLCLYLPNGYAGGRAIWTDGARHLNGYLDHVFHTLEERVINDDWAAAERHRRLQTLQRGEARRAELAHERRIEDARYKRATHEISAWQTARDLLTYSAALRERLDHLPPSERDRIEEWCKWVDHCSRRSDPTHNTSLIVGIDDARDGQDR